VQDQDLKAGAKPSRWVTKGSKYGIAIAQVPKDQPNSFEVVSQVQTRCEASQLSIPKKDRRRRSPSPPIAGHRGVSPTRSRNATFTPDMKLIKATESTLCVSWTSGTARQPHTLYVSGAGPRGDFQPISCLDPATDARKGELCYIVTHLQAGHQYHLRVDIGSKRSCCEGVFKTLNKARQASPVRPPRVKAAPSKPDGRHNFKNIPMRAQMKAPGRS